MVDMAAYMLVRSDISHVVVIIVVIETGAVPSDSDAAGIKAAEVEELEMSPDVVANDVVVMDVVEALNWVSYMLMVVVFIGVVKTADKVVPSTVWLVGSYVDKALNVETSNVSPSKAEAAGVLIAILNVVGVSDKVVA